MGSKGPASYESSPAYAPGSKHFAAKWNIIPPLGIFSARVLPTALKYIDAKHNVRSEKLKDGTHGALVTVRSNGREISELVAISLKSNAKPISLVPDIIYAFMFPGPF